MKFPQLSKSPIRLTSLWHSLQKSQVSKYHEDECAVFGLIPLNRWTDRLKGLVCLYPEEFMVPRVSCKRRL